MRATFNTLSRRGVPRSVSELGIRWEQTTASRFVHAIHLSRKVHVSYVSKRERKLVVREWLFYMVIEP